MNGYNTTGFTQSLNGIVSITDGNGTTIENGTIQTGDILGDDIVSNTITSTLLKTTNLELYSNLILDNDLEVKGNITCDNSIKTDALESINNNGIIITDDIKINDGKSLYITDGSNNYTRLYHEIDGGTYIEFSGGLIFKNLYNNHVMFNLDDQSDNTNVEYNMNTHGIKNYTNPIINDASFTQNADFTCKGNNAHFSALCKFSGTQTFPTTNSGTNNGTSIYWNSSGYGDSCFLNMSTSYSGGFSWYTSNNSYAPKQLLFLDGNANLSGINILYSGDTRTSNLYTSNIDIKSGIDTVNLYPNAYQIFIGSAQNTTTTIKCYLTVNELANFDKGINCSDTSSFTGIGCDNISSFKGIINDTNVLQNNLTTDCSSLTSTSSTIFNGGLIVKKNIYANDVMTNNLVSGNIGCGNLNSSNNITCIKLNSDKIKTNTLEVNEIAHFKGKVGCNINLGIASYLSIPLSSSISTTTGITNFNLQTYLINSNNNTIFIQPYYSIIFYNNGIILQIIDNSTSSSMLYQSLSFNQNLPCTNIALLYKNLVII